MESHVKALGVLYLVFSALGVVGAVVIFLVFGGIAGFIGVTGDHDAQAAAPIVGIIGTAVGAVIMLTALPGLIAGWGILERRRWARFLGIALSALNLLHIPFGTMLGAYGLWVLLSREGTLLFEAPVPQTRAASPSGW